MPSKPLLTVTVAVWLDDPRHRSVRLEVTLPAGPVGAPGHRHADADVDNWCPAAPYEAVADAGLPAYGAEVVTGTSPRRWTAAIGRTWPGRLAAVGVVTVFVLAGLVSLVSPRRGPQADAVPASAATTSAPDPWSPASSVPVRNPLSPVANIATLEADPAYQELIDRVALVAGWSSALMTRSN